MRLELRWHGRGGQGAVTAAEILAIAAIKEGYYAQAFPEFGAERRGAPVRAYTRISDEPIYDREPITNPDYVIVLDPTLPCKMYAHGLRESGGVVLNSRREPGEVYKGMIVSSCARPAIVAVVDATSIALKHLKAPIVNTAMLGAFARITGVPSLESIHEALELRFGGKSRLLEANMKAVEDAYKQVKVFKV